MKLTILSNELDDCLLYVDNKAFNDIDYRYAECILWLKDIIGDKVSINLQMTDLSRKDFPDKL